jgi:hypothetical protein
MTPHPHLVPVFTAALLALACTSLFPVNAAPRNVTLHNDRPRFDIAGQFVDAHDGMLLAHTFANASTMYFLYGEFYNLTSGGAYPSTWGSNYPQLSVYTSDDMVAWTFRGVALDRAPSPSSKWIPRVFYDKQRARFVMWYGCGQWCVATSDDGLVFSNVTLEYSRYGASDSTDGALLRDTPPCTQHTDTPPCTQHTDTPPCTQHTDTVRQAPAYS